MNGYQKAIAACLGILAALLTLLVLYAGGVREAVETVSEKVRQAAPEQKAASVSFTSPAPEVTAEAAAVRPASPRDTGVVSGVVYTMAHEPVANADVRLVRKAWAEGIQRVHPPGASQTTLTGSDGRFAISGLEWGRYDVEASLPAEKGTAMAEIQLAYPLAHVTIHLREKGAIAGRVVNERGAPVPGAELLAYRHDKQAIDGMLWELPLAISGGGGEFRIDNLEASTWSFLVRAPEYAPLVTDPLPVGGSLETITLKRGTIIRGLVAEVESGAPVAEFPLVIDLIHYLKTDAQGRFETLLADWSGETIPIHGVDERFVLPSAHLIDQSDAVEGIIAVELKVSKAASVSGYVLGEATQEPLAGCVVEAHGPSNGYADTCDAEGFYEIHGLAPGATTIKVTQTPRGYSASAARANPRELTTAPGMVLENLDFVLPEGISIRGVVVDAEGSPVPGAEVIATSDEYLTSGTGIHAWEERDVSDERGAFEVMHSLEGAHVYFSARAESGYVVNAGPMEVPPGGLAGVRLVLAEPLDRVIFGQCVDEQGRPVAALVTIWPYSDVPAYERWMPDRRWPTDLQGYFTISELPRGAYSLWAQSTGKGTFSIQYRASTLDALGDHEYGVDLANHPQRGGIRLVLARRSDLSGQVLDASGNPISGAKLTIPVREDERNYSIVKYTGQDGGYMFKNLRDGEYTVTLEANGTQTTDRATIANGDGKLDFMVQ
ncbi:MAG: hypothetical protein AMXMBFR84_00860 [Candidatus Hydrogenedentota bacterium]